MRNKQKLLIEQLDTKLAPFYKTEQVVVPDSGWIKSIRSALNMTLEQLGNKLNITRQSVKGIEDSESHGTITLNSLKEVGKALDLKLVYGFVPKDGSIDQLINRKAETLARKIVMRTHQNMKLEDQGIEEDKINKHIEELAADLKREMKKSLWD